MFLRGRFSKKKCFNRTSKIGAVDGVKREHKYFSEMSSKLLISSRIKKSFLRFTIGVVEIGLFLVPWDTGLKFITLHLRRSRGDLEIKDYLVMQKPQTQANRLPPPLTFDPRLYHDPY